MQMVQLFSFFFPKKETHICFLYVYIKEEAYFLFFYIYICSIYISIHFFLHFSRAGTVHTPGTEACHTCIAFAFYSWLAGRHNVIQAVLHLVSVCTNSEHTHTHRHFLPHSLSLLRHTHTTIHHVQLSSSQSRQRHTA